MALCIGSTAAVARPRVAVAVAGRQQQHTRCQVVRTARPHGPVSAVSVVSSRDGSLLRRGRQVVMARAASEEGGAAPPTPVRRCKLTSG